MVNFSLHTDSKFIAFMHALMMNSSLRRPGSEKIRLAASYGSEFPIRDLYAEIFCERILSCANDVCSEDNTGLGQRRNQHDCGATDEHRIHGIYAKDTHATIAPLAWPALCL